MRDWPIAFLILLFAGMLFALSRIPIYQPVVSIAPEPEPVVYQKGFTGRVVMPSLDDMYVLENSAERDLLQFERFLQGRAASLHYASAGHFKKSRKDKDRKNLERVLMGVRLTLDSMGRFTPEILFSNTDDENFKSLVVSQIETYWRYPRSENGNLVVWFPVVWNPDTN